MPPLKKRTPSTPIKSKSVHPAADRWNQVWDSMARQLKVYKEKHGNCLVPQRFAEDPKLGRWVNKQRENKDNLSPERKAILDGLGFQWSVVARAPWQEMFERLVEYKKQNGNCLVPQRFAEDPRLGGWVREQRKNKDNILPERKKLLDSIGFTWRARGPQEPNDGPRNAQKSYDRALRPTEPQHPLANSPLMPPRMAGIPPSPCYPGSPPSPTSKLMLRQELHRLICIEEEREAKANICILELLKRRRSSFATSQGTGMAMKSNLPPLPYNISRPPVTPYMASQRSAATRAMLNHLVRKSSSAQGAQFNVRMNGR